MGFAPSNMKLTSTAFSAGGPIPTRHTGEGEDVSPQLSWTDIPDGTQAFAVICHDPDAPLVSANGTYGFVHWVLYNIPGSVTELAEGTGEHTAGKNNMGNAGYNGPMPPEGHGTHYYYFWVLALNRSVQLDSGLTMWELLEKIEPHVIGMSRLIGSYKRG
jgi:Raf kinase inhibitor-like YbhB/YbcL family protein